VAVLGATGFIGRWVARALTARGAELHALARCKERAARVFAEYGVRAVLWERDLEDVHGLEGTLAEIGPTIAFNVAGYGVGPGAGDDARARRVNVDVVGAVCRAMRTGPRPEWKGQRLVHVGSVAEYGPVRGVLSESSDPRPTTPYGTSKLAGTLLVRRWCQRHGLAGLTARLFTVYGPGEAPTRLLPLIRQAARAGRPLPLTDGLQRRDFTFVEDVAEGLLRLGQAPADAGEIVHLGSGALTTVRSFAETAARVLGMPDGMLRFGVLPRGPYDDVDVTRVAVDRLRALTGWVPGTTIPEGIRQTLAFDRDALSGVAREPAGT
jgi:nucleoside-diphosphate-sugar epimerase